LYSELDWWYKYVKENKGDKKDTRQFALVLAKIFQYLFVYQYENPQKPSAKVKRIREEIEITLENKKKVATNSPRNVFKRKNKVEEGRSSCLGMKREQECTDLKAQKMMRGKVESSIMLIMVRAVPTMVHVARQTTEIPQMTIP
jgi:hypothetical protein